MSAGATRGAAASAADWLCLAAAPAFAMMALLTAGFGDGPAGGLCAAGPHAAPLGHMALMYALMSACHVPPWLRLLSRRSGCRAE